MGKYDYNWVHFLISLESFQKGMDFLFLQVFRPLTARSYPKPSLSRSNIYLNGQRCTNNIHKAKIRTYKKLCTINNKMKGITIYYCPRAFAIKIRKETISPTVTIIGDYFSYFSSPVLVRLNCWKITLHSSPFKPYQWTFWKIMKYKDKRINVFGDFNNHLCLNRPAYHTFEDRSLFS